MITMRRTCYKCRKAGSLRLKKYPIGNHSTSITYLWVMCFPIIFGLAFCMGTFIGIMIYTLLYTFHLYVIKRPICTSIFSLIYSESLKAITWKFIKFIAIEMIRFCVSCLIALFLFKSWKLHEVPPPGNGKGERQISIEQALGVEVPLTIANRPSSKGRLKFLQWNARNLNWAKVQEITPISDQSDVLIFQESGSTLPFIRNYSIAACDKRGQGTAIYVKHGINYEPWISPNFDTIGSKGDFVVCGIIIGTLLVLSAYVRPLGSTTKESRIAFVSSIREIMDNYSQVVIGGDFNDHGRLFSEFNPVPESPWEILIENDDVQILNDGSITRPQSGKALDGTFAKNIEYHDWMVLDTGYYSSDHFPIWFEIGSISLNRLEVSQKKKPRKFTLVDWTRINKNIIMELENREVGLSGSEKIIWWCDIITKQILEFSKPSRKTYCPWWNAELKTLKSRRSKLRRTGTYAQYAEAHSEFRRVFQKTKRRYFRMNLFKIAEHRNPFKGLYEFLPGLRKKRKQSCLMQDYGAYNAAMNLGHQFAEISNTVHNTRSHYDIDTRIGNMPLGSMPQITKHELLSCLHGTKDRSSTGCDEIGYGVWKRLCKDPLILEDIRIAMDEILRNGDLPPLWRQSIIHPVPKESGGFRPISLLNSLSKVMDKIVLARLENEIDERAMQFGCRKGHSTQQAIIRLLHNSAMAGENGDHFLLFSLDLSKAYDRLDISKLVTKLLNNGVSRYLVVFIDSWLRDRSFKVRVNGVLSDEFRVNQGLPQGSPLSVALWKIYVSDFPVPDSNCQAFMDDIIFWETGKSFNEARFKLQRLAQNVESWLTDNQMTLNIQKSRLLANKTPFIREPIVIHGCHYFPLKELKYLGINLLTCPDGPDFALELSEVKTDLKRRCAILSKVSRWIPSKLCSLFGKSLVLGKLNFYLAFLGAENKETLRPLEVGLNEALRFITGAFKSTPIPLLHSKSKIPPLGSLIRKAAGNLWISLQFHPTILTRDYEMWEATGNNGITPLGALWEFESHVIQYFQIDPNDNNSLEIDGGAVITKNQSEALHRCHYMHQDLTKEQALQLNRQSLFRIPKGDIAVWTDGSKSNNIGASGVYLVDEVTDENWTVSSPYKPIFSSFEIEVCAMIDGLREIMELGLSNSRVVLCTDSQSAIKHLISLSMNPRIVSNVVYELVDVITELIKERSIHLSLCWVPGHSNIGYNDKVDQIAKDQLQESDIEDFIQLSIPRTRIQWLNNKKCIEEFKLYLEEYVSDSHWPHYPPRRSFKEIQDKNEESFNRKIDIAVFRMRTGHNRLRKHLKNIKIEESELCRFCSKHMEDCFHLLAHCSGILTTKEGAAIFKLRREVDLVTRKEYHDWLFDSSPWKAKQRKGFLQILQRLDIHL